MNLGLSLSNSSVVGRHADAVEKWRMMMKDDASTREKKCGEMVYSCMNISFFSIWARAPATPYRLVDCFQQQRKKRGAAHHTKAHKKSEVIPKHSSFHHQLLSCFSVY
jgi:hypothetical protein